MITLKVEEFGLTSVIPKFDQTRLNELYDKRQYLRSFNTLTLDKKVNSSFEVKTPLRWIKTKNHATTIDQLYDDLRSLLK